MKLYEVFEPIPGLRRALLHIQQELAEHDDTWESEILKSDGGYPVLNVTAKRQFKLEPGESLEVSTDLYFQNDTDGIRSWINSMPTSFVKDWDSPRNLEDLATTMIRRLNQKLSPNRPTVQRLANLRDLASKFPQAGMSCPTRNNISGIALMADNSHAKLYVYPAASEEAPNYAQNVGYLLVQGNALLGSHTTAGQYIETIQEVEKAVKKWVKANS